MTIETRHLKLILAVAEEGNITRAGNRLHLTQSALSHQLRDIEEHLGTTLFLRLNKRLALTQAGERLLNAAHLVLDELKRAEHDIHEISLNREGILRIATQCYTCYHWLPSIMKKFNQLYAKVEIRVVVEATDEPLQALLDDNIDLAIVSARERDRRINFRDLFKDEMIVIMSPTHRLANKKYITAEDFIDETVFSFSEQFRETSLFENVLLPAGIMPKKVMSLKLSEAVIEMVKAGMGVSTMARWAVAPIVQAGLLKVVPLTKTGFHRTWQAATLASRTTPPYLEAFIKLMEESCQFSASTLFSLNSAVSTENSNAQKMPGTSKARSKISVNSKI